MHLPVPLLGTLLRHHHTFLAPFIKDPSLPSLTHFYFPVTLDCIWCFKVKCFCLLDWKVSSLTAEVMSC